MEANRTNATTGVQKGNCCAGYHATSSQEKSAKSTDKENSKHASPSNTASNCCCGDTQKAKK